jgi:hypothetical protein
MAMRPGVHCWITFFEPITGHVIRTNGPLPMAASFQFKVRYSVANEGCEPTGSFKLVGALTKDGIREMPNPIPAQELSLGPGDMKTFEHTYFHPAFGTRQFHATMMAEFGSRFEEKPDSTSLATATLSFTVP